MVRVWRVLVAGVLLLLVFAAGARAAGDVNMGECPANEGLLGFSSALAECRAYEQVTPAFKDGQEPGTAGVSADGSRLLGGSLGAFAGVQGDHTTEGGFYEFSRVPSSGWATSAITPADGLFPAAEFEGASGGLERSLWLARTPSQSVFDEDLYVREADGQMVEVGPVLPPSKTTGPPAGEDPYFIYFNSVSVQGAADDLSHVLFTLRTELPPLWPGDTTNKKSSAAYSLYEYAGVGQSEPKLVGVSDGFTEPAGERLAAGEKLPAGTLISDCGTDIGSENRQDTYNAVSASGTTVFFTAVGHNASGCTGSVTAPEVSEVYARVDGLRTVALSEPRFSSCGACETSVQAPASFAGASENGLQAFFMTAQPLLEGATTTNLYEYDFNAPEQQRVFRVSTGSARPEVQGVARVSEDGSHVYFVAKGVLLATGTATTTSGSDELTAVSTASGTGDPVEGEQFVGGVVTSTGVFAAGQTISGAGIAPGTTITRVGEGFLELSAPAEASGTGVALSAGAQPFAVGDIVTGAGIPAGDTITEVNGQTLTLSVPASASASGVTVTAANREGVAPVPGGENLYVYERDEADPAGRLGFVATLSPQDARDWSTVDEGRPVQASGDGRFLVFQSAADLTQGDEAPEADPQVFEYDAQSEELARVSVGQAGYAPGTANANANTSQITTQSFGSAPDSPALRDAGLAVSGDGATVVFESAAALTAGAETAAAAGADSVYEYHSAVATGGRIGEGDVYLVSDGEDVTPRGSGGLKGAFVVGIDSSGEDVFFGTADPLVAGDGDTQYDLYDARVDGGFPLPPVPASCEGEGCYGPVSIAPSLLTGAPGAPVLSGAGDPAGMPGAGVRRSSGARHTTEQCGRARKRRRRRRGCVRAAKHARAGKAGKRAGNASDSRRGR
jgi:hypothetical protein